MQTSAGVRSQESLMDSIRNLGRLARNLGMRLRHPRRRKQLTTAEEKEVAAMQSSKEILKESIRILGNVPRNSGDASKHERNLHWKLKWAKRHKQLTAAEKEELAAMQELVLSCAESEDASVV